MSSSTVKRKADSTIQPLDKRQNIEKHDKDNYSHSSSSVNSPTLLQKIRARRDEFVSDKGTIAGKCVVCAEKLSLSWHDWSHHFLEHTHEQLYCCTECGVGIADQT